MKILLGTYNIAGWISEYKFGFEALGHTVTSTVFSFGSFYKNEGIDINLSELCKLDSNKYSKLEIIKRTKRKFTNLVTYSLYKRKIKKLIDEHDIVILLWRPFFDDFSDYEYIKKQGKKLVVLFVGSDARYNKAFVKEFNITQWTFPKDWLTEDPSYHLKIIRTAELYADLVYSVPDQAGLQLRPYYHLQVPLNFEKLKYVNTKNEIPKVIHAPSVPFKKGTDIILRTITKLKEESLSFDFQFIQNLSHEKLLELLTCSDILVDEIIAHGPGALGFEAMGSGCAVATRFYDHNIKEFQPPIHNIEFDNIYPQLRELLLNKGLRSSLIETGYKYAKSNNNVIKVCNDILQNAYMPKEPDYIPTFLREIYEPSTSQEQAIINQWTNTVKGCDWYKQTVSPSERAGLIF